MSRSLGSGVKEMGAVSRSLSCAVKEIGEVSRSLSSYGVKEMGIIPVWPKLSPEAEGSAASMMKN